MDDESRRSPQGFSTPTLRPISDRPAYKLSVGLLSTYKQINDQFYEARRKRHAAAKKAFAISGHDDDQGNYVAQPGEEIADRYVVQETLGKGSFGVVVKAHDRKRDESVAVKIIKNKVQFYQQAKVETEILTRLNTLCTDEQNIVKLKKVFTWKDHLCLVFELLSFNLYDLLKYTKFNGISLNLIRKFAFQILRTLEFLASPEIDVIHCDLKPENVLLRNPKRSSIKVIDFGSSCFGDRKMFKYIQSRFYRAPEVILGLHYTCAIDMWSLGAILVEMHTGQPVFDGKDEADQLIKMACVLGAPSQRLVEQSPKRRTFFQWDAKQKRWILAPPEKDPSKYNKATLEEVLGVFTGGPGGRRKGQPGHSEADYLSFLDLVKRMFVYSAESRITPTEALRHPFLAAVVGEAATAVSAKSPRGVPQPPVDAEEGMEESPSRGVFPPPSTSIPSLPPASIPAVYRHPTRTETVVHGQRRGNSCVDTRSTSTSGPVACSGSSAALYPTLSSGHLYSGHPAYVPVSPVVKQGLGQHGSAGVSSAAGGYRGVDPQGRQFGRPLDVSPGSCSVSPSLRFRQKYPSLGDLAAESRAYAAAAPHSSTSSAAQLGLPSATVASPARRRYPTLSTPHSGAEGHDGMVSSADSSTHSLGGSEMTEVGSGLHHTPIRGASEYLLGGKPTRGQISLKEVNSAPSTAAAFGWKFSPSGESIVWDHHSLFHGGAEPPCVHSLS